MKFVDLVCCNEIKSTHIILHREALNTLNYHYLIYSIRILRIFSEFQYVSAASIYGKLPRRLDETRVSLAGDVELEKHTCGFALGRTYSYMSARVYL